MLLPSRSTQVALFPRKVHSSTMSYPLLGGARRAASSTGSYETAGASTREKWGTSVLRRATMHSSLSHSVRGPCPKLGLKGHSGIPQITHAMRMHQLWIQVKVVVDTVA